MPCFLTLYKCQVSIAWKMMSSQNSWMSTLMLIQRWNLHDRWRGIHALVYAKEHFHSLQRSDECPSAQLLLRSQDLHFIPWIPHIPQSTLHHRARSYLLWHCTIDTNKIILFPPTDYIFEISLCSGGFSMMRWGSRHSKWGTDWISQCLVSLPEKPKAGQGWPVTPNLQTYHIGQPCAAWADLLQTSHLFKMFTGIL